MKNIVVVGGGTAGSVLAARLSEDPLLDITLIEAGFAGETSAELLDGASIPAVVPGHVANWGYEAWLQPFPPHVAPHIVPRGRVLGGSSAINGGYFVRARPQDFERWAEVAGPQWAYERALPFLKKLESDLDFGGEPGHGISGPLRVQRPPQSGYLTSLFTQAARELGFVEEVDKNAASAEIGVGPVPSNIIDGTRVNTAMAYLSNARERPNLEILGETRVLRVRIDNGKAVGVETLHGFIAADEVILAAGAVASPHILMHSGIGPADLLEAHGITSIADLPVGQEFSDHPSLAVSWHSSMPLSNPHESFAFPSSLNFNSSGFHSENSEGDLEILLAVKPTSTLFGSRPTAWSEAGREEFQLLVTLQQPKSRGRMKLVSNDPLVQPRIDYNYLQDDSDKTRMRVGVRTAVALLHASPFVATFIGFSTLNDAVLENDERLDEWIEAHLSTAIHLSGSAPIGDVVDWQGRVHGVDSLRVADTSILPTVPSRGTFNTAVFIGEFIAHQIIQIDATDNP